MKVKFIILFNSNRRRSYYKYKIIEDAFDEYKLNRINGFNEKLVGMIAIPYTQYSKERSEIAKRKNK